MKLLDFDKYFPDEQSCKDKFKELRDKQGVICPKCGCLHHYWKTSKEMYQCAKCGYRQSLRANTVMYNSKLPFRYWFIAMHLLTSTKHTFSGVEIQNQLGHKRYQPIWEMLHKLRSVMGKRDEKYMLHGEVEVDEGFFTTEIDIDEKEDKLKAGAGSQAKTKVLVMAESSKIIPVKKGQKEKKVGYIKMSVIPNLKSATIDGEVVNAIDNKAEITSDATKSHCNFGKMFSKVDSQVIKKEDTGKVLPWVHIAISNSKSLFTDMYHGVKKEYLQEYLNEFCYKFNRRYFGEGIFERLLLITTTYQSEFEHRIYNKNVG